MRGRFVERELRLREPLATAWGQVSTRPVLELHLEDSDGFVGLGECAPLPGYDDCSFEEAAAALRSAVAAGASPDDVDIPQAHAGIETAMLDLRARREGIPLHRLLGGPEAPGPIAVNAVIGALAPDRAADEARTAAAAGFTCLKLKAGTEGDFERVRAVRDAVGPGIGLRLDANGSWDVGTAIAALERLAPLGIELVEEPVNGLDALDTLRRRVDVPLAIDETARDPAAVSAGVADYVCLKIGAQGGPGSLVRAARRAREAGSRVYLASALDGPAGIAAALHAAAAVRPDAPSGLATLALFRDLTDPFPPRDGWIAVPHGPGLGDGG